MLPGRAFFGFASVNYFCRYDGQHGAYNSKTEQYRTSKRQKQLTDLTEYVERISCNYLILCLLEFVMRPKLKLNRLQLNWTTTKF